MAIDPNRPFEHVLRGAVQLLARRIRAEHTHESLSEPEFAMLMTLDIEGPTTAGELARRDRVSPSLTTRTLGRLEQQGYVERERSEIDARRVVVSISKSGKAVILETRRQRNEWMQLQLADLDPKEREILREAAPILLRLAYAASEQPEAR